MNETSEKTELLLDLDVEWLKSLIRYRLQELYQDSMHETLPYGPVPPDDYFDDYASIIKKYDLSTEERLILILALTPYFIPEALDDLYARNTQTGNNFTELGGIFARNSSAILPTGETAAFLLSGKNTSRRIRSQFWLSHEKKLHKYNLVYLEDVLQGEPWLAGRLIPSTECLTRVLQSKDFKPSFTSSFPAQLLKSPLEWEDLVLNYDTGEALTELDAWLAHHRQLDSMPEISKKFKKGYRALFHGPPGTGKTLTASLLGKRYGLDVYRIDLAMVVSKYIGETEKSLKSIFDLAENKDWILFFDEADALFGKRTQTQSSNDRYANQEVSYLLQRIEDFNGLILLASNFKANMDKAFLRRFQSVIYFPMPDAEERYVLWKKAFSAELTPGSNVNLRKIAKEYEISGALISNVLRYCILLALGRKELTVPEEDIITGIKRELAKEGKLG